MGIDPFPGGQRLVAAQVHSAVGALPLIATLRRLCQNVKQLRECLPDVAIEAVLVIDVIDPQASGKSGICRGRPCLFHSPERLHQVGLSPPDGHMHRPSPGLVYDPDDLVRSFRVFPFPDMVHSPAGIPLKDPLQQCIRMGIAAGMLLQPVIHCSIGTDMLTDQVIPDGIDPQLPPCP